MANRTIFIYIYFFDNVDDIDPENMWFKQEGATCQTAKEIINHWLESENPFNPEKVEKILKEILEEAMENMTYNSEKCAAQAKWASDQIKSDVKKLEFDRYKIIVLVTFGEKNQQDVFVSMNFLWDAEKDKYAKYTAENNTVYGIALCFGLYYE
ncbi:unnamed protein product [Brassicogethes aeneus]|uniref:Uncharacterized protein n=1 Tax=Brassicogethes aeneus TaxID=1431903 RepID=A0A9P0AXT8_BRAAE|nr:unnamed protein product [Brassicogethes aeneus]